MPAVGTVDANLKTFNAQTGGMEFFGPILSPAGLVTRAVAMLTDAQFKALPTTPVALLAAPGAGFALVVVSGIVTLNAVAGAYTNVDALANIFLGYGGATVKASSPPGLAGSADVAQRSLYLLNGARASASAGLQAAYENVGLSIAVDNNGMGVFTGGNAANACRVSIDFVTVAL